MVTTNCQRHGLLAGGIILCWIACTSGIIFGEFCTQDSDCSNTTENISCVDNSCSCVSGFQQTDQGCQALLIGMNCSRDSDCALTNSRCRKGACRCPSGYMANATLQECVLRRINDVCVTTADCNKAMNNSLCNSKSLCQCQDGFREINESACVARQLEDLCNKTMDCKQLKNAHCKLQRCACKRGFTPSNNGTSVCMEIIIDAWSCKRDEDCKQHFDNVVCGRAGICQCQSPYHLDESRQKCARRILNDSCSNNTQCANSISDSECVHNRCKCTSTHLGTENRTRCTLKLLEGQACLGDDECQRNVNNSYCDVVRSNACLCSIGYISGPNFDVCLEKQLGDSCSLDAECNTTTANSMCSPKSRLCECLLGFVATDPGRGTASKSYCGKRVIADQSCENDDECTAAFDHSFCANCSHAQNGLNNFWQRCNPHREGLESTSLPSTTNTSQISPPRACLCQTGFAFNDSSCKKILVGGSCRQDQDCVNVDNSFCELSTRCNCKPGFRIVARDQCTRRKIDEFCRNNSDCQNAVPYSHCSSEADSTTNISKCVCNLGYKVNALNTECHRRQIGDKNCTLDPDCSNAVNNSICRNSTCVCQVGFYRSLDHTQCHSRQLHQDYCDTGLDCTAVINHTSCLNHRCVCNPGFYEVGSDRCGKRRIADSCATDKDCTDAVEKSACVDSTCACISGFASQEDNSSCVRRKVFDSGCVRYGNCADAVANSHCENETCLCDNGFYGSDDRAYCIRRNINDTCNATTDCEAVIPNSDCTNGRCDCLQEFDAWDHPTRCVPRPSLLEKHKCFFLEQCQRIDPASVCLVGNVGNVSTCRCVQGTFTARNRTTCVRLPRSIGDECLGSDLAIDQCLVNINHSVCDGLSGRCSCSTGYYADPDNLTCTQYPEQLGDTCHEDHHCHRGMNDTTCETSNHTCICRYGFTQVSGNMCQERDHLPQYQAVPTEDIPACNKQNVCEAWNNSLCVAGTCRCDFRHARPYGDTTCVPIQTYELELAISLQAATYDYVPLEYSDELGNRSDANFSKLANQITQSGLMSLFASATSDAALADRYVSSEVREFQNLDRTNRSRNAGVLVRILLHLTANYMDATPTEPIQTLLGRALKESGGLLGSSTLMVSPPFRKSVAVRDYNECANRERNDCHAQATCINTLGSFMCVCFYRYEDVSRAKKKRPGRECVIPSTTEGSASDLCSSNDCETRWEFVALAVTLFLLIVLVFIIYEIIQRKKTFTARKLYEKFGTTKIRKLRHASMQRLRERKKQKKEEEKKKKEEERLKKEELKREKSLQRKQKDEEVKKRQDKKQLDKNSRGSKKSKKSSDEDMDCSEHSDAQVDPTETAGEEDIPSSFVIISEDVPEDDANRFPGNEYAPDINIAISIPIEESPV